MSLHDLDDFTMSFNNAKPQALGDYVGDVFSENCERAINASNVPSTLQRTAPFGQFVKKETEFYFQIVKPTKKDLLDFLRTMFVEEKEGELISVRDSIYDRGLSKGFFRPEADPEQTREVLLQRNCLYCPDGVGTEVQVKRKSCMRVRDETVFWGPCQECATSFAFTSGLPNKIDTTKLFTGDHPGVFLWQYGNDLLKKACELLECALLESCKITFNPSTTRMFGCTIASQFLERKGAIPSALPHNITNIERYFDSNRNIFAYDLGHMSDEERKLRDDLHNFFDDTMPSTTTINLQKFSRSIAVSPIFQLIKKNKGNKYDDHNGVLTRRNPCARYVVSNFEKAIQNTKITFTSLESLGGKVTTHTKAERDDSQYLIVDMKRQNVNYREMGSDKNVLVINAESMSLACFDALIMAVVRKNPKTCEFRGLLCPTDEGEMPFLFFAQNKVKGCNKGNFEVVKTERKPVLNTITVVDTMLPMIDQMHPSARPPLKTLGTTRMLCIGNNFADELPVSWTRLLGHETPSRLHKLFGVRLVARDHVPVQSFPEDFAYRFELDYFKELELYSMCVIKKNPHDGKMKVLVSFHGDSYEDGGDLFFYPGRPMYISKKYDPDFFECLQEVSDQNGHVCMIEDNCPSLLIRDRATSFPYYKLPPPPRQKRSKKKRKLDDPEPPLPEQIAKALSRYIHEPTTRRAEEIEKLLRCDASQSTFFVDFPEKNTREASLRCLNAYFCCSKKPNGALGQFNFPSYSDKTYNLANWMQKLQWHCVNHISSDVKDMIHFFWNRLDMLKNMLKKETTPEQVTTKRRRLDCDKTGQRRL